MLDSTVLSQVAFFIWFAVTHWIPLPPLNDLSVEAFEGERQTNIILHVIEVISLIGCYYNIMLIKYVALVFWNICMVGHVMSWWMPYFFGWPKVFLENAEIDNARTIHFLPKRGKNPIPDVVHCVIGVLSVWVLYAMWSDVLGR